jgi:hypothetical protein
MAKIISSRIDDRSVQDTANDLVDIICDVLRTAPPEPADTQRAALDTLIDAVSTMANKVDQQDVLIDALNMDVLGLTLTNMALTNDLRIAVKLLGALNQRPTNMDPSLQHAFSTFTSTAVASFDSMNGALELTFREQDLREAFQNGIADYINEVARSTLA